MPRLNTVDIFISDRFILNTVMPINVKFVTQQLQKRAYWNSPNLFTTIDCLEMESVPLYSCCDIQSDCMISRSKMKLPQIVDCFFGLVIRGVWAIDGKSQFKELDSPSRLVNLMNIYPHKTFDGYYFIHDNYLYVTTPDLEKVKLSAFFKDVVSIAKYSCNTKDEGGICPINPLDQEFNTLPKLEDDIVSLAIQKLAQIFLQVPQDRTSDDRQD